ncbi:MAG TPA: 6-carboxytetrahydropterin synthase QueD [Spirochaetia bacterium]|nr:6-carboxytetrahydropterin synthase QueD [Spirochaetales bacterium]HRS65760.1 6-carboxytetrahydropterin synthase QueD [Spirochaetia bacterium]HOT59582.1 6-carboxytetrahydropterin synthase QueD [Spirochaetales bacterium]HPD80152.1 6-carboxytetrahydropterin synthase QueD [Spirochaetales bacterium]HQK34968.1 6-carboxytetrahydropterin synthase QueD [Spirochaetales bacterium]
MYTIRIEQSFSAAHYLTNFHGKCENLHGHNYTVRVYVTGQTLDKAGMLVDFGIAKHQLKNVLELLDHKNLNDIPEFQNSPSAERIAQFIYHALVQRNATIPWQAVEVFETETSMARYEP